MSGPFQIAAVYGLRKEPDKMFEWLERAYTEHDPGLTQLLVTPFIMNYRDDPRFAAFCQKLKMQVPPTAATKPMSDKPSFFAELKRRNVYKVAVAYAVVAWLLIQAASILFPTFEAPGWVMKVFVAVVVAGFPIALILAWAFELTPEGLKRTESAMELPRTIGRSSGMDLCCHRSGSDLGRFVLSRALHGIAWGRRAANRIVREINCGSTVRKPERRQGECLLRDRYSR